MKLNERITGGVRAKASSRVRECVRVCGLAGLRVDVVPCASACVPASVNACMRACVRIFGLLILDGRFLGFFFK